MSEICGKEEHPFTISSQPGTGELIITVKSLGDYTSKLKEIPSGTKVLFDGPYECLHLSRMEDITCSLQVELVSLHFSLLSLSGILPV
jgi:predicted ferric reductase